MELDETIKTILIYVWRSNIEITCDQVSQRKRENLRTAWSQVNEEKIDIERDSLPALDIIQQTKAELFSFFLVSVYALSFLNDF